MGASDTGGGSVERVRAALRSGSGSTISPRRCSVSKRVPGSIVSWYSER